MSSVTSRPVAAPPESRPAAVPGRHRAEAGTALARSIVSGASLLGLAVGLVGLAFGADRLQVAGLLVYLLVGVGSAPWATNSGLRLPHRLTLTAVTSFGVLTLTSLAMLAAGAWHPWAAFAVVAAATAPLHVLGLRRALAQLPSGWRDRAVPLRSPAVVCAVGGAALCLLAAVTHRHIDPGFLGFLPRIGPLWYVGLLLILVALPIAGGEDERQLALTVALLAMVITLTPALVYDGPRSQSAGKHVDFVTQIRILHRVDSSVPIYQAWAGFFAAAAWLCDVTGIRDPMRLATFWPPLLVVFRVSTLRYLFGQIVATPYQAWVGVALALLADPIGADYFSPQSVGFVLGLAAFGLAFTRRHDDLRLPMLTLAGATIAVSHQLSPYVIGGALGVLVLFRRVRPWWVPGCILGPAVLWALLHYSAIKSFVNLGDLGQAQNFRPPQTTASAGLERLPIIGQAVLALMVCIAIVGLLALVGLVRRRRDLTAWALATCPAVGLVLVAVNPYGQEGIFRAALFGLPWLAALAAGNVPPLPSLRRRLPVLAVTVVLATSWCVASFALDITNVLRPGDLAAFRYFRAQGGVDPANTYYLLNLGTGDLPSSPPAQAGTHLSLGRDDLGLQVRQEPRLDASAQERLLTRRMVDYSREPADEAHLYALWSPVSSAYAREYGIQSPDQFAALRDAFSRSPRWTVAFESGGTVVFRFVPPKARASAGG